MGKEQFKKISLKNINNHVDKARSTHSLIQQKHTEPFLWVNLLVISQLTPSSCSESILSGGWTREQLHCGEVRTVPKVTEDVEDAQRRSQNAGVKSKEQSGWDRILRNCQGKQEARQVPRGSWQTKRAGQSR